MKRMKNYSYYSHLVFKNVYVGDVVHVHQTYTWVGSFREYWIWTMYILNMYINLILHYFTFLLLAHSYFFLFFVFIVVVVLCAVITMQTKNKVLIHSGLCTTAVLTQVNLLSANPSEISILQMTECGLLGVIGYILLHVRTKKYFTHTIHTHLQYSDMSFIHKNVAHTVSSNV